MSKAIEGQGVVMCGAREVFGACAWVQVVEVEGCEAENTVHHVGVLTCYLWKYRLPQVGLLRAVDDASAGDKGPVVEKRHIAQSEVFF